MIGTSERKNTLTLKTNWNLSPSLLFSTKCLMTWLLGGKKMDHKFHPLSEQ